MRRSLRAFAVLVTGAVLAAGPSLAAPQATSAPRAAGSLSAEAYVWRNVRIDGGGFVPGIVFNRTEKNLIYARTDIGGAYRWSEATRSWTPLLDWVGQDNWGYNGVISLASDPVDPDRVYAALGMYTNGWDPNNGAIGRSTDRGATWQVTPLPFKNGGNMPGRGMGERLAVDPNRNSIVYYGAEGGHGLWRSIDHGVTWARVTSFPNPGNYAADPADVGGYNGTNQGVVWVTFDETTGTRGSTTQTVYVGVADRNDNVYRSTDGGESWERVPGQPTGFIPHEGVLDAGQGFLYVATSSTGGPYDGNDGQVWQLDTRTGAWTDITPDPAGAFGYSGLTIDRQRPGTIMVGTQISWWPDTNFYRSTDGGATWTRAWEWSGYPQRTFRYRFDITDSPWVDLGDTSPAPPDTAPKLGWMNQAIEIDPFDSDRLFYGTGLTVYSSTDLTRWDTGGQATIRPTARGLEETAVLDLISPPTGAPLISGLGDLGGFRHADLDVTPSSVFTGPRFTTTTSLDVAELDPSVLVRAGTFDKGSRPGDMRAAFSTDGGVTWRQGTEPSGVTGGGTIAAAADGSRFVWSPAGAAPHVTADLGGTWSPSRGLPAGAVVESDRADPARFYGLAGGTLHVSTDGGATFAAAASGLGNARYVKAVPGRAGELWLAGGSGGLLHSTDSGATFTRAGAVARARNIGFGRAAPGREYPALYLAGTVGGVSGVHRSDDAGATWVRINDDRHQYGNMGEAITGDPRVYGRVYLGTNGRGVLYADPAGGTAR
jgi:hypothetical protein